MGRIAPGRVADRDKLSGSRLGRFMTRKPIPLPDFNTVFRRVAERVLCVERGIPVERLDVSYRPV